jgi:hypothetical protein
MIGPLPSLFPKFSPPTGGLRFDSAPAIETKLERRKAVIGPLMYFVPWVAGDLFLHHARG